VNAQFQPHLNNTAFSITLDQFANRWVGHPSSDVDLCAMPYEPLRQALVQQGRQPFCTPLPESVIPGTDVLENLFALKTWL